MLLALRREAFDHPDSLFELKWDGFRTLAHGPGGGSKLVSRNSKRVAQLSGLSRGQKRQAFPFVRLASHALNCASPTNFS